MYNADMNDMNTLLHTETAANSQANTTNALGLDPTNPMTYVLIACVVLSIALVVYLIVLMSDSNKELTKIRELLEKQSSTGNPAPSGAGEDKEPQTPQQ
jgi:hypothetical protein